MEHMIGGNLMTNIASLLFMASAYFGLGATWAVNADEEIVYIRLDANANQKLTENFHGDNDVGNDLAELPKGEQTFAGAKFKVGEMAIQLRSTMLPHMPEKIEGIKVDRSFAKLYVLHGCGWGAGGSESVSDGTVIGQYIVHYEDNTRAVIPIAYGKDVRDWWNHDNSQPVTRGKVAWTGSNDLSRMFNVGIRLFLSTWENPQRDKKVRSMDYIAIGDTAAAPFCVAMTVESK
jgi:hypothetical protein